MYLVLFLLLLYVFLSRSEKEGFSILTRQDSLQAKLYRNDKIYDPFYTYNYDDMILTIPYAVELIQKIQHSFQIQGQTLCIGSRTGHIVQLLSTLTRPIGLDSSPSMVKMSRYKYPSLDFVQGVYTDSSIFSSHKFSQVILPMMTLHTIPQLKELCYTVKEWMIHSGFFFVCMTDIRSFPIYKLVNHYPSPYFQSNYTYAIELKDKQIVETITDTQFKTRTNIQDLYEYNESTLIYEARNAGFIHVKTIPFESIPVSILVFQYK